MRKNIIITLLLVLFTFGAWAQQSGDVRTEKTKIADLLMQFPSKNSADYDRIAGELSKLGEPVIATIVPALVPPGGGDDSQMRFALSGLVKYVASGKDKNQMKLFSQAICKSLATVSNNEVKDFLLQELQYIAGDEAVTAVAPLLSNQRLCDPAARVLTRINSEASNSAMLAALTKSGAKEQLVLVQALGITRYKPALKTITDLAKSNDRNIKKATLLALAQLGDPSSADLLAAEAKKAGYTYNPVEASESYFRYLKNLIDNGNSKVAAKAVKKLSGDKTLPVNAKINTLVLQNSLTGGNALPALVKALESNDKEYRAAALSQMGKNYSPSVFAQLQKILSKTQNGEIQSEILYFLGTQHNKNAVPVIAGFLNSRNSDVQKSAIQAMALAGGQDAVAPLTKLLVNSNTDMIPSVKAALLNIGGEGVANAAAAALANSNSDAKVALMEIIARRQAQGHASLIFAEAGSSDAKIREAAATALASVARKGDDTKIAALLNNAKSEKEIPALQQALFASLQGTGDNKSQVKTVSELISQAGQKTPLYYAVLARIGGQDALSFVEKEFETGSTESKDAAIQAIATWSDYSALGTLSKIARESQPGKHRNAALNSYISGINRSPNTSDQKVLMFRNAMELASSKEQKTKILEGVSRNSSLMSLVFAARYLDDPELQQAAVQAVRIIVTNSTDMYGETVAAIANKAISLNKDAEAEYQKQELLKKLSSFPSDRGYYSMFNEKDLTGWKGLAGNPISRSKMTAKQLTEEQKKADERMRRDWRVENDILIFEGEGFDNLCSEKMYGDFEMFVDWRMEANGDGGVYLRGSPQVQTWDISRVDVGAQVGSGGLYNNQTNRSTPLRVADNPINEWNTFRIKMIGDKVTVYLNGILVTDNVVLENYWNRNLPIFEEESIELQAHGTRLEFRDIYVREIPRPVAYSVSPEEQKEGFAPMFNGIDLDGWTGNKVDYFAQEGMIVCQPSGHGSGNLYTEKEYSDFIIRFEFQLTPGANNGLGIRSPLHGDAAYVGMELQILDNDADIYKNLEAYQYHGSVYGVIPAKRGFLKPVGEWNVQEVQAIGNRIKITLNGEVILDGDIAEASKNGTQTIDNQKHPGLLNKSGHIGFLGHGSSLKFRNLRIKTL
ncbi:MAG: DUF1080 domain-containing protein [Prolixibacteraceae bacterium]|nr:DUF1080 domain-containing protein [Prolixibacteraceae bacterium]